MNDNNNNGNRVIKSGIWYTAANFITKGINFLTIPIFTRLLTKAEFGNYNNFLSWLSLMTIISTLSLSTSLIRARFDYKDDLYSYVKSILVLGTLWTSLVFIITQIGSSYFTKLFSMSNEYIIYMFIYIAVAPALDIFQNLQQFQYKYKFSVTITIVSAISTVGVSLLLMAILPNKYLGRMIGAYVPLIIICCTIYIYFVAYGGNIRIIYWKYALKICLPFVPHLLAMTILNSTDRVMITKICGSEATALYSLAYTCSMAVSVLWNSFNTAFSPWLGEKLHGKDYDAIYKISIKYILLFAIPVIGIMLISPELILILGGKSYISSKYVMPPVMLGCFFQFLYSMYVNIEQFEKKTIGMAVASACAALLNLGLNAVFIPIYGYVAAAYTTLIGYIFLALVHFWLVRRMGMTIVYNNKGMIQVSLIIIFIGIGVNILYKIDILRYIIIGCYIILLAILLYRKRDVIIHAIKK